MCWIFNPCVNRTLRLLDGQIGAITSKNAKIKVTVSPFLHIHEGTYKLTLTSKQFVILVGGFGTSEYLLKRIKEHCMPKGIEVIRPRNQ
jgi:tRNA A37 threonylcarbamoyltransferase TsaD